MRFIEKKHEPKTYGMNDVLDFGAYRDCPVSDVVHDDPGWLMWAVTNIDWFDLEYDVYEQVEDSIIQKKIDKYADRHADRYMDISDLLGDD